MRWVGVSCFLLLIMLVTAQETKYETIRVNKNYDGPFGTINLVGVCQISESEVSCWDADRNPNLQLENGVKKYLENESRFSLSYGKKNRVAFFETSYKAESEGQIDSYPRSPSGFTISIVMEGKSIPGAFLSESKDLTQGSVTFNIMRREKPVLLDSLEPGKSYDVFGRTLKVIRSARTDLGKKAARGQYLWTYFAEWNKAMPGETLYWRMISDDGADIPAVDRLGQPRYVAPDLVDYLTDYSMASPTTKKYFYSFVKIQSAQNERDNPHEQCTITTNIDPQKIGKIRISKWGSQIIVVDGIPLDPR